MDVGRLLDAIYNVLSRINVEKTFGQFRNGVAFGRREVHHAIQIA